ncbi:PX domain containing protein [Tritrichomonas foetus]|uniref:PX domain containing protein n=1 Tax=Tritrichomonas foetus TaxID=1144522 RepID=A0A1J4K7G8_9EUKA|nr:PX domain containing protein [Tritrichomonas foetus]|eukprot:OHT05660.1 PX domain containing protein [Tritrichomonas foetus]
MSTEAAVPITSLAPKKLAQLQGSTVIPRMYLFIENFDLDPTINAVVYTIEIGIQKGQNVHVHTVRKRYSALQQFDEMIRPLFRESRFLQEFPPKKLFGNKNKDFLDQRADSLQKYLTNLVRVAGIINTPAFIRCFEIDPDLINEV